MRVVDSHALAKAGNKIAESKLIIAIAISSSIRVELFLLHLHFLLILECIRIHFL